jgi:hypothetical protein
MIEIRLTSADMATAEAMARARFGRGGRFTVEGHTMERELCGAAAELAFAAYLGRPHPDPAGSLAHQCAASDLYGWQVRAATRPHYGLGLHQGDSWKRFAFLLGHEIPVFRLVGWIIADWDARAVATEMHTPGGKDGGRWWRIDPAHLHPFPYSGQPVQAAVQALAVGAAHRPPVRVPDPRGQLRVHGAQQRADL